MGAWECPLRGHRSGPGRDDGGLDQGGWLGWEMGAGDAEKVTDLSTS